MRNHLWTLIHAYSRRCNDLTVIKHRHTIGPTRDNYTISKTVDWSLSPPSPPEPSSRVSSSLICHQQMSSPDYPQTCFYSSFTPRQLLVGRRHLLVAIPCLRPVSTWMLTSQQMILRRMTTTNLFMVILMFRTSKFQLNKDWDILLLHFLFSNYWSGSVKECWWCWVPHLFCGN